MRSKYGFTENNDLKHTIEKWMITNFACISFLLVLSNMQYAYLVTIQFVTVPDDAFIAFTV